MLAWCHDFACCQQANVQGLGLEKVGIDFSERGIKVNEFMQTKLPNVYASGDVVDKRIPRLTPTATFESNYIAEHILGKKEPISYPVIPNLVFTLPRPEDKKIASQRHFLASYLSVQINICLPWDKYFLLLNLNNLSNYVIMQKSLI